MAALPRQKVEVSVLDWIEAHVGALGLLGSLFVLPLIEYIRRQNLRLKSVETACTTNAESVKHLSERLGEFKKDMNHTVERMFTRTDRIDRGIARIEGQLGTREHTEDDNP